MTNSKGLKTEVETTTVFSFPNKKLALKPITRGGGWLGADHDGAFQFTGGATEYCLPLDLKRNRLVRALSIEEEEAIGNALGADLRINLQGTNNFFRTDKRAKIKIIKDDNLMKFGYVLDLSDPMDYLHYKILLANKEFIAPTWEERYNKPTYKFALVSQDQEAIEHLKKGSAKANAYKHYDEMKDSHLRMLNFLTVYGKRPIGTCSVEFLQSEILNIIDSPQLYRFLEVAEDADYSDKLLVDEAVRVGAIQKQGKTKYALLGGDVIGNTLTEAVEYFKDKRNNEVLIKIKAQIEMANSNK